MNARRSRRGPRPLPSSETRARDELHRPVAALGPLALAIPLLAIYAIVESWSVFHATFLNDDYVFIDLARHASFLQLFDPARLPFHWYRPLSSSVYFWLLQKAFGLAERPQFLVQLALLIATWIVTFVLARRLAGPRVAAIAVAGTVAMTAWTPTVLWISGGQELWMLLWAQLALLAFADGRQAIASLLTVVALLSKETAVVLPAVFTVYAVAVGRRRGGSLARAITAPWVLTVVWAILHPWLRRRLHPESLGLVPAEGGSVAGRALHTIAAPFNLHLLPAPEGGWGPALAVGALGALLLGALVLGVDRMAGSERGGAAEGRGGSRGLVLFALAWAVLAWLPLLAPTGAWNAYYALFGAIGCWLALALLLARSRGVALALIAAVAILRPAVGDTPVYAWGHEAWQRYSGEQMRRLRDDLLRQHPTLPRGSRLWFANSPRAMNIIGVHDHPFRVWYADTTIHAAFMSDYRPPAPGTQGRDYFFNDFPELGWVETVTGPEDVAAAQAANPHWAEDHDRLGGTFYERGNPGAGLVEFVKLANAFPDRAGYAYKAGACALAAGRLDDARRWLDEAVRRPVTSADLQGMIETSRRELDAKERAAGGARRTGAR